MGKYGICVDCIRKGCTFRSMLESAHVHLCANRQTEIKEVKEYHEMYRKYAVARYEKLRRATMEGVNELIQNAGCCHGEDAETMLDIAKDFKKEIEEKF